MKQFKLLSVWGCLDDTKTACLLVGDTVAVRKRNGEETLMEVKGIPLKFDAQGRFFIHLDESLQQWDIEIGDEFSRMRMLCSLM